MRSDLSTAVGLQPVVPGEPRRAEGRIRLEFLDGMRGLTALYVVFHHIVAQIGFAGLSPAFARILDLTRAGQTAVSIFIVLSGYCLMLPVAQAPSADNDPDTLPGFRSYIGRRARRILPPYYAALALFLLVMAAIPGEPKSVGYWWSSMWPAFTPGVLLSHLFLVHNLSEFWVSRIDAPMWSIATEWQIYFLFPLILLPVFRRSGAIAAIVTGTVIGLAPLYFFHRFEWASPWFVGLFAMGMAAAQNYPGLKSTPPWQRKMPWGWLSIALALLLAAMAVWGRRLSIRDNWKFMFIVDFVSGLCTACLIIWAAARSAAEHARQTPRRSLLLRFLTSTWVMRLGGFSYSLYLTHALTTGLTEIMLNKLPLGPNQRALIFLGLGAILAVGFAYVFYLAFERPFLRSRSSTRPVDMTAGARKRESGLFPGENRGRLMKAAILPSAFHPSLGGVEELVRQLSHQLRQRGRTPVIVANRWPRSLPVEERFEGIPVYRAPLRVPCGGFRVRLNYWLTHSMIRRHVVRILRQHSVDLIHVQCVSGATLYALHAKRQLGLPLVVTLQGELTMDADRVFERDEFTREILRTALREADVITGCSQKTLSDAEAFFGQPFGDRARVIFNGAIADDFRQATPYNHPRPYVLALGRLVHQKGFDTLLRAFASARPRGWDLVIAGDGADRTALQTQAGQLGLEEAVRFVGRADRALAGSLFKGCGFVVIPSRADEGLPVVIAEAMAAGKPVLGTRVGGVPEAVLDGKTGLLVDRDDVPAMAAALTQLASDEPLRARLSVAATQRSELFSWPLITDQYEAAYQEACERRSAARGALSAGRPLADVQGLNV